MDGVDIVQNAFPRWMGLQVQFPTTHWLAQPGTLPGRARPYGDMVSDTVCSDDMVGIAQPNIQH